MIRILQMETNNQKKVEVLYPELSYKIVGLAFEVHNELGPFAREKQYADLLEEKFKIENVKYRREFSMGDSGNIADFIVGENKEILLELKTVRVVGRAQFSQIQNYLQRSHIKLGILINFSDKYLRPKRVLRMGDKSQSANDTNTANGNE